MAKKDLKDLGEVYGNLGKEETTVVAESTDKATVGDESAAVGEAPLEDGGTKDDSEVEAPQEVDCATAEEVQEVKEEDEEQLDEAHCDEEDKEEEGEHEDGEHEDGEHAEEDEENALETAQAGINNFMAKKSAFDELYSKVISEDFGMEEQDDLNALGIEDATPDAELGEEGDDDADVAGEEEVTVTLDKELAKTLCDLLKAAMGEEKEDDAEEGEHPAEDGSCATHSDEEHAEEDNEGELKAMTTHVDMGDNCCVGKPEGLGGEGKGHADGGKSAEQSKLGDSVKNDQKVGASEEIGETKVEPKNKEVKAG